MAFQIDVTIQGTAPLMYSKVITSVRETEGHDEFERKTWKERLHTDREGYVTFPGRAVKNMMVDIAGYRGEKVKGGGGTKFKGKYEASVRAALPWFYVLDSEGNKIHCDQVSGEHIDSDCVGKGEWHHVPSDGRKGGGKRVWKRFPFIHDWKMDISLWVLDEIIEEKQVISYLSAAGIFKGLGSWRPGKGGDYGTFIIVPGSEKVSPLDE